MRYIVTYSVSMVIEAKNPLAANTKAGRLLDAIDIVDDILFESGAKVESIEIESVEFA